MLFKRNKKDNAQNISMPVNEEEILENEDGGAEATEAQEGPSAPDEKVMQLERELQEAKDQTLRRTAEMDNMRRRFNQEREVLIFEGNKRLIMDLLPIIDDLERTLVHADKDAFRDGVELVYRNFLKVLERYGVKSMEVVGKPFDVHAHDALMEEPSTETPPGTVTKEIQKGYMMNDTILRHAKVIVSKAHDA